MIGVYAQSSESPLVSVSDPRLILRLRAGAFGLCLFQCLLHITRESQKEIHEHAGSLGVDSQSVQDRQDDGSQTLRDQIPICPGCLTHLLFSLALSVGFDVTCRGLIRARISVCGRRTPPLKPSARFSVRTLPSAALDTDGDSIVWVLSWTGGAS